MEDILKKFLKYAAIFAAAVFLIQLAVCWLSQIWWILLIIAILVAAGWFGWRWWKNHHGGY